MAQTKNEDNQEELSFEQAVINLKAIMEKIEDGQIPLQESIAQYEEGMSLINHCREILQQAEQRIEKIAAAEEEDEQ